MAATNLSTDPTASATLVSNPSLLTQTTTVTSDQFQLPNPSQDLQITPLTASVNSTVSSNLGAANSSPTAISIAGVQRSQSIQNNPLDNYIDVTYGMSLAMVSKQAVNIISAAPVNSEPMAGPDVPGVTSDMYIVFASTAESKTSSTRPSLNGQPNPEYYNIKGMQFKNFIGHLPQNPMTASIFDAKMRLFEPYGFSLRDDIESMRQQMGYDNNLEPLNYIYRLEIWFSGWHPDTGERVERIQFPLTDSINLSSIVYYITITTVDATVSTTGTEYFLSMQIMAHKPMRADSLIYRMESVSAGKQSQGQPTAQGQQQSAAQNNTVIYGPNTPNPTLGTFLQNLSYKIAQQVKFDTTSGTFPGLNILYKITGPDWLLNAPFDGGAKLEVGHGSVNFDTDSGTYVYASQDIDLFTFIYNVLDQIPLVRQLLSREDDTSFLYPSITWNIRSNIVYPNGDADARINGYSQYEFDYYIEPVLSYRSRTTVPDDRNYRVQAQNQQQRAENMIAFGMVLREYDFLFTNDNSEVIDLDFKFRMFYQEPYPSQVASVRGESGMGDDPNYASEQAGKAAAQVNTLPAPDYSFQVPPTSQSLLQTLGQSVNPQSSTTTTQTYAEKHQGMVRQGYPPQSMNSGRGQAQPDMALYQYAKQQYFRFDMIDANMTVRFDPTWLFNSYMANGDFTPRLPVTATSQILYAHVDRAVLLRASAPLQSDFMNPYRTGGSSGDNIDALSGFYQVLSVMNEFDGGKFTQKLNMLKYVHLNGFALIDAIANVTGASQSIQNQVSIPVGPTTPAASTTQQSTTLATDPAASSAFLGAIT